MAKGRVSSKRFQHHSTSMSPALLFYMKHAKLMTGAETDTRKAGRSNPPGNSFSAKKISIARVESWYVYSTLTLVTGCAA